MIGHNAVAIEMGQSLMPVDVMPNAASALHRVHYTADWETTTRILPAANLDQPKCNHAGTRADCHSIATAFLC